MDTLEMQSFDAIDFLAGDDTELEFDISDFSLIQDEGGNTSRYIKPKFSSKPIRVEYVNAMKLAESIKLCPGEQIHSIVPGDFIFGDFIEALLTAKKAICDIMYLSTLSMSQNNIDSLANLLENGYIKHLTIMISNYFYSHEKNGLIPYMLNSLDKGNRFDCLVCRNHTKITLMQISNINIVLSGSSNLRSSQSIEQFILQENAELYDFYKQFFSDHSAYSIINQGGLQDVAKKRERAGSAKKPKQSKAKKNDKYIGAEKERK